VNIIKTISISQIIEIKGNESEKEGVIIKFFFAIYFHIFIEIERDKIKKISVFHSFRYFQNLKTIICLLFQSIENRRRVELKLYNDQIRRNDNFYFFGLFRTHACTHTYTNESCAKLINFNRWKIDTYFTIFNYHKKLKKIVIQIVALGFPDIKKKFQKLNKKLKKNCSILFRFYKDGGTNFIIKISIKFSISNNKIFIKCMKWKTFLRFYSFLSPFIFPL